MSIQALRTSPELCEAFRVGNFIDRHREFKASTPTKIYSATKFVSGMGAAIALLVGTGGALTPSYVMERDVRGYKLHDFGYQQRQFAEATVRTQVHSSNDDLAFVRSIFKPSVTELASIFGVSRQTIYNWQANQPIAEQNEKLVVQLALAAVAVHAAELDVTPSVLRRKLPGGKTLMESVRDGIPGSDAAFSLIEMIQDEARQRQTVTNRLAGRGMPAVDVTEIGKSYYNEKS